MKTYRWVADREYRARIESLSYGSFSGPAGQSLPYMQIGLRVERAYNGTSAGTLASVYVLGGCLASASGRRLLIPGLPILAVGERAIVFANHASFPYALTHAWQPVSISGATLAARPRCAA